MPQEYNFGFAFLEKAFAMPDAVALRTPTAEMTYGQLRTRVIRYAQHLKRRGVDRNSCVAIEANRMPEGLGHRRQRRPDRDIRQGRRGPVGDCGGHSATPSRSNSVLAAGKLATRP